ncbi:MAG: N-acetyltransferase [Solirubrobacterales bacterium]|nr:N-acetyltransferase [Solirubrobacterales bacterium]
MTENGSDQVTVEDEPASSRFEIHVGDELAGFADYRLADGKIAFTHTEIDPARGGQGLGTRLVEYAVTDARARDLEIVPICPFVRDWIAENPERS